MSLTMLLDQDTVRGMMVDWPTTATVHDVPADSRLAETVSAQLLDTYLDTGTAPADKVIVIRDGAALHPRAYTTAGDLDPAKMAKWRRRGYTVQLRTINRWYPPLHAVCAAVQAETGYGCYVTGFMTPAGGQGLNHHWDQSMGIIYQVAGRKTWQLWEPIVEEPHRNHLACNTRPTSDLVDRVKTTTPDQQIDLGPGQVLVLPRGWMHNVHARGHAQDSIHLTFVVRERTGVWIAEKLAAAAIALTELRRVIPPADVVDRTALAARVDQARSLLMGWLASSACDEMAADLLNAARTESDVDYA
jgi:ribosomal protein L16 Arg81 hydroxylase